MKFFDVSPPSHSHSHSAAGSVSDSLLGSVSEGAKRAMPSLSQGGGDRYPEGVPLDQNPPPLPPPPRPDEPDDIAVDKQGLGLFVKK